jgi:hypothetical protein
MRLPGRNPQRQPASDPDALLTNRTSNPVEGVRCGQNPGSLSDDAGGLGANKPYRISVCENQPVKKPGPCNRPGCWLQILNYKFLTNRLTSSFCEGNFIFRRLGKKNGCGNLNVENNITLLDESAGGTDSSCKFFTL